jgi:prephenate dehydrogenase
VLRAAVVGTGLIGGSILLRLHQAGLDVCGWDPDAGTRRDGRGRGLTYAEELTEAVRDRQVVFLCGPLPSLPQTLATVAKATGSECVITDVGSTKSAVASFAVAHGLAHRFVPGHPMAGTERAGLAAAAPALFSGAAWVLCPLPDGSINQFHTLANLIIEIFEARIVPMSPSAHDAAAALASHIPHLLAGSLAGAVARSPLREAVLGLAAGSFRDGTRVAGAPSRRTADMLIDNRAAVLRQVESVRAFLAELSAALQDDDPAALERHYAESRELRRALLDRPMLPAVQTFSLLGAGEDEREFLLELGESGGYLTGCATDDQAVSYSVFVPAR